MVASEYYTEEIHGPHQYFELGDFLLETGYTLRGARLAYKTHGTLSAAKDNAILFPHFYSARRRRWRLWLGEGRPLDPTTVLHHHPRTVRGRVLVVAEQHAPAVQSGGVPAGLDRG